MPDYLHLHTQLCDAPQDIVLRIIDHAPILACVNKAFYNLGYAALLRNVKDPCGVEPGQAAQFNPIVYKKREEQATYLAEIASDDEKPHARILCRSLSFSIANDHFTDELISSVAKLSNVRCMTITAFAHARINQLLDACKLSSLTELTLNLWSFDDIHGLVNTGSLGQTMPALRRLKVHTQCGFVKSAPDTLIYPQLDDAVAALCTHTKSLPQLEYVIVRGLIVNRFAKSSHAQLFGTEFDRVRILERCGDTLVPAQDSADKIALLASAYDVTPTLQDVRQLLSQW
ncbi:hypothetical protein E3P99_03349 [Wallemia hederae]|uniref:Uncharacterized protein n=1 Tax=Wallemia hederae TaxID=1540922 RepID=A0A4T0FI32_9BASI|nr:hypothetical protein E3P99_03349 [Wallemia hederae]